MCSLCLCLRSLCLCLRSLCLCLFMFTMIHYVLHQSTFCWSSSKNGFMDCLGSILAFGRSTRGANHAQNAHSRAKSRGHYRKCSNALTTGKKTSHIVLFDHAFLTPSACGKSASEPAQARGDLPPMLFNVLQRFSLAKGRPWRLSEIRNVNNCNDVEAWQVI